MLGRVFSGENGVLIQTTAWNKENIFCIFLRTFPVLYFILIKYINFVVSLSLIHAARDQTKNKNKVDIFK
jgi:hypothetical protein